MRTRIGSVWQKGPRKAIAVQVGAYDVLLHQVIHGGLGHVRRRWVSAWDGKPRGWTLVGQQPTLRCVDGQAARAAVAFLHDRGIEPSSAFACGDVVVVSMAPPSVLAFAEDAYEHGWADDEQCARMIGDLG